MVRIGDFDLTDDDPIDRHLDRTVSKIVVHPNFNGITYENDVALLKLEQKVNFADHIQPVCLPPPDQSEDDPTRPRGPLPKYGTVAGWGRIAQG